MSKIKALSVSQMNVLQIILGLIVVTTGLKLYWFFVAVMVFVFGMYIASDLFHVQTRWLIQIIGLVVGVIGVVLGVYQKQIAIVVVSFISGGYGAYYLAQLLGIKSGVLRWIFFNVGGILGIIMVVTQGEWALILLSSWGGATLVCKHLNPQRSIAFGVFLTLTLVGILVQAAVLGG
jgi:hypothetical protein